MEDGRSLCYEEGRQNESDFFLFYLALQICVHNFYQAEGMFLHLYICNEQKIPTMFEFQRPLVQHLRVYLRKPLMRCSNSTWLIQFLKDRLPFDVLHATNHMPVACVAIEQIHSRQIFLS